MIAKDYNKIILEETKLSGLPYTHEITNPTIRGFNSQKEIHEYKLNVIKSYLSQDRRLRRLQPWYSVKKPLEQEYLRRFKIISQVEGKRLFKGITNPETMNYLQSNYKMVELAKIDPKRAKNVVAGFVYPVISWFNLFRSKGEETVRSMGNNVFNNTLHYVIDNTKSVEINDNLAKFIIREKPNDTINFLLNSHSYPACQNTTNLYQNSIDAILNVGFKNEWTEEEISNALKQFLGLQGESYPQYVYDRIARNETARFGNEAKIYAWQQAGVEEYDWIQGPGPCNEELICLQRAEAGPYKVGEGPMPIDDTHINCLCEIEEHVPEGVET